MSKTSSSYREDLISQLKEDKEFQIEYLKSSLEENSDMPGAMLLALRTIAEARGFESFAKEAGLSQKSLYKILPNELDSKPKLETIVKLLDSLGLRLAVEEKDIA